MELIGQLRDHHELGWKVIAQLFNDARAVLGKPAVAERDLCRIYNLERQRQRLKSLPQQIKPSVREEPFNVSGQAKHSEPAPRSTNTVAVQPRGDAEPGSSNTTTHLARDGPHDTEAEPQVKNPSVSTAGILRVADEMNNFNTETKRK